MTDLIESSSTFSIRLTASERAFLETAAGKMPLGTYVKWQLIKPAEPAPKRRRPRETTIDYKLMARVLALLGRSGIAANLNQLARAANQGTLQMTPEIAAQMAAGADHAKEVHALLMEALKVTDDAT